MSRSTIPSSVSAFASSDPSGERLQNSLMAPFDCVESEPELMSHSVLKAQFWNPRLGLGVQALMMHLGDSLVTRVKGYQNLLHQKLTPEQ